MVGTKQVFVYGLDQIKWDQFFGESIEVFDTVFTAWTSIKKCQSLSSLLHFFIL